MSKRNITNTILTSLACMALLTSVAYSMGCPPTKQGNQSQVANGAPGGAAPGGAGVCANFSGACVSTTQPLVTIPAGFTIVQFDSGCAASGQNACVQAPTGNVAAGLGTAGYHAACGPNLNGDCEYWMSEGGPNTSGGGPDICQNLPAGTPCAVCQNNANTPYICDMRENNARLVKAGNVAPGQLGATCSVAGNGVCDVHAGVLVTPDANTPCDPHLVCALRNAQSAAGY